MKKYIQIEDTNPCIPILAPSVNAIMLQAKDKFRVLFCDIFINLIIVLFYDSFWISHSWFHIIAYAFLQHLFNSCNNMQQRCPSPDRCRSLVSEPSQRHQFVRRQELWRKSGARIESRPGDQFEEHATVKAQSKKQLQAVNHYTGLNSVILKRMAYLNTGRICGLPVIGNLLLIQEPTWLRSIISPEPGNN